MKEALASLSVDVFVDCPHCEEFINLMDEKDTSGVQHNDDGNILRQAIPSGDWTESHRLFSIEDVKCSACGKSFNVKGLEW